jgi:hypothetical protein
VEYGGGQEGKWMERQLKFGDRVRVKEGGDGLGILLAGEKGAVRNVSNTTSGGTTYYRVRKEKDDLGILTFIAGEIEADG